LFSGFVNAMAVIPIWL